MIGALVGKIEADADGRSALRRLGTLRDVSAGKVTMTDRRKSNLTRRPTIALVVTNLTTAINRSLWAGVHAAAALKHHFLDRDVTLRRMWFSSPPHPPKPTEERESP